MSEGIKENVTRSSIWMRGLYMILFGFIYSIAEIVIGVVVLFQFGFALFTGKPNDTLTTFGQQLSVYVYLIFRFLTFNSEYKPFPFDEWSNLDRELTSGTNAANQEEDYL